MNNTEKKMWAQQLKMLSSQIESMNGETGTQALLTTLAALADQAAGDVSLMSRQDQELMLPAFYQLAGACEKYSVSAGTALGDTSDLTSAKKRLGSVEKTGKDLQKDLEKVEDRIARQQRMNADIEIEVGRQKDILKAEEERGRVISKKLSEYSPDKLEQIRIETDRLNSELKAAFEEMALLDAKRKTADAELSDELRKVEAVQREIETYDEETRKALYDYREKREELAALETAEVDCSEEKREELQAKIDKIKPAVEKLRAQKEILDTQYAELEKMETNYDRERAVITSNVFETLDKHMSELETAMEEQKNKLLSIEKQAGVLHENMEKAAARREELKAWFDSERTPLEAMCAGVSKPDSEMLKRELDPGKIQEVRELTANIEEQIGKLDNILMRCFRAAAMDKEALRKKTPR